MHGQHNGSGIHKSYGRDEVPKTPLSSNLSMELVSSATPFPCGISYPREAEHGSRHAVQISGQPARLETESCCVPKNKLPVGFTSGRPVCVQNHQTGGEILQLETRSSSGSSGCIQTELDGLSGICKSPMGIDRSLCTVHPSAGCYNSFNNSTMASSTMVSSIIPSPAGQPKVTSTRSGSANQPSRSQDSSPGESQQTGRIVHLRQLYRSAGITEETTSLLLASWRSSTTKNYNSSWRVWEWCVQSGTNPISSSLSNILNFIAFQFGEGIEYRSLNCYRSALSSVLSSIDGFDVGRHPLVCRILKGAFQLRPPKAKYTTFWSVEQVLNNLASWVENHRSSVGS